MAHDLVIRDGIVVDGTGAPPRRADVAIDGDRIVEIAERVDVGPGTAVIDAEGRHVTPGFVDIHTHLDAQIAWDPIASSSCWHGVTSVVLGNCGVTFAPVRPGGAEFLAEMMQSVEDIPKDSIMSGLPFTWETYGDYLGWVDTLPKGINVGGMVGHCAVRYHAMGERGLSDPDAATPDDIDRMVGLVDEAIAAGALGFSTSRTFLHVVPDGRPVPGTHAGAAEMLAIASALGRHKRGVFEGAMRMGERDNDDLVNTRAELAWMGEVGRATGRPVTFGLAHSFRRDDLFRRVLAMVDEERVGGADLRPQTTVRGIGILFGLSHRTPFDRVPSMRAMKDLALAERVARLRDPQVAATVAAEIDAAIADGTIAMSFDQLFLLGARNDTPSYRYVASDSLAAHARAAHGGSIGAAFVARCVATDGTALWNYPALNQRDDAVNEMQHHPAIVMGLGDSGAHVGQIMDASQTTYFLVDWVRDRQVFPIEEAVRRLTSDTANLFGLGGRGVLRPGAFADVNVIDMDRLALRTPEYVNDFPGGAGRFVQRSDGYDATIVNGREFMRNGAHTGSLSGSTLRSGPDLR